MIQINQYWSEGEKKSTCHLMDLAVQVNQSVKMVKSENINK